MILPAFINDSFFVTSPTAVTANPATPIAVDTVTAAAATAEAETAVAPVTSAATEVTAAVNTAMSSILLRKRLPITHFYFSIAE